MHETFALYPSLDNPVSVGWERTPDLHGCDNIDVLPPTPARILLLSPDMPGAIGFHAKRS